LKSLIAIIIFFIIPVILLSQELDIKFLENILEKVSVETGSSPEIDAIEQFIEHPIYLKRATISEFLGIPGFTTSEARDILRNAEIDTINSYQQLFALMELSDEQKYLLNLCSTLDNSPKKLDKIYFRTRTKDYLREPRGFTENIFQGNAFELYNRITGYFDEYSAGFLVDKDAGEVYLADHYSCYLSGSFDNLKFIVGDYYIETGMGNILWKQFPVSKSSEVIYPAVQKGSGIREYRSSIDYRLFRGAAIEYKFEVLKNNISTILFVSNSDRAGTYDSLTKSISSVFKSGYYRTKSEISKKNAYKELLLGGNLEWKNEFLSLGLTAIRVQNDKELRTDSKSSFLGKEGNLISAFTFYNYSNFSFGSELSYDAKGNAGFKSGSQYKFSDFSLAMHFRSYTPGFRSPYGMNFGEMYAPNNERGLYTGLEYKGVNKLIFSAYADLYESFEKTYTVPEPIHGVDIFFQTEWKILPQTSFYFRGNAENKTDAVNITENYREIFQKNIYRFRVELDNLLFQSFSLRVRLEANLVKFEDLVPKENGFAGFLESKWDYNEILQTGLRFSAFSTKSFESAIYQYEMALPGYMTTIPMYGDGFRFFIYTKVSLFENIDIWLRYSITKKNNVNSIGNGYLEIPGNRDERVMMQLDMRF